MRAIVLTDEPYYYPDLDNVMTPKAYKSPLGKAKHKAKALDYFRSSMGLTPYDWVLHMDEESTMDRESLRGCFDFIRYNTGILGRGSSSTTERGDVLEELVLCRRRLHQGG